MKIEDMIHVMTQYMNGEKIQCSIKGEDAWRPAANPGWEWGQFDYRVEPKVRYVNIYDQGAVFRGTWVDSIHSLNYNRQVSCIGYLEDKQDGSPIVFHSLDP